MESVQKKGIFNRFSFLGNQSDIFVAFGVILILAIMVVPLSPFFLDFFLGFTLMTSILVLLMALYSQRPLDFAIFPSILLFTTFLRLSLNVASTRNILLHAGDNGTEAAGNIIKAFGEFVVGGNFAVGIILFIILIVINFMVITKGAGRVAEVAARFTLDAMPGKQMAIDADLNAGLIDEQTARERRKEVTTEADFYGAMDGASKFVRGDAIAGIIITLINIIGGIVIGVAQNGMTFKSATEVFTLLTVGDGLVAQIPAIVISLAAGFIVTKNSNDRSLGEQVEKQFGLHPKSIYLSGAAIGLFALVPGFPKIPFIGMSVMAFYFARKIERTNASNVQIEKQQKIEAKRQGQENLEDLLNVELLEMEVGYGLVSFVDAEQNGDLLERIGHIRKQFASEWGLIIPSIRIRDNLELRPGAYSIKLKGIEVAKGELQPDHLLAMDPGTVIIELEGIKTTEPVFGLTAVWIGQDLKDEAAYNGYTVVDPSTIMATHITEMIKNNLHEFLGRQELVRVLDNFKVNYPKIVGDLIPDIIGLGVVLKVLQNLLREAVPIKDLRTILESLAENGAKNKAPDFLTEHCRASLYRVITERIKDSNGEVPIYTLDRAIEEAILGGIITTENGQEISLEPKVVQSILAGINEKIDEATQHGEKMIILCSPMVRSHFKRLTEKFIPNLVVVAHNEIAPEVRIRSLGTIRP